MKNKRIKKRSNKNNKKKVIKKYKLKKRRIKKNTFKKKKLNQKKSKKNFYKKKKLNNKKPKKKFYKKKNLKIKILKKVFKKKPKKETTNIILKIIRLQDKLKPKFNFNLNFYFSLEKMMKSFFKKIEHKINDYKIIKEQERRRKKLEEIKRQEKERGEKIKQAKAERELNVKIKERELKEEIRLEKERVKDIKLFLRKEQAIVRQEQAEKQKKFLKQLQLEKQIEKFRIREIKELEKLEKVSLKEKREDYSGLQERIKNLKEKYRIIRDQKIRERVEALGVKIQGDEDRETLLLKEKEYTIVRQRIELSLESFYRSASSLVFQLNKRHVTRHMSIFRCIDRRFETGEIFIKWDESNDNDWLLLIYIKNNSPDEGIVIEDKSNREKNLSHEFKSNEIFKASDMMVDSLTQLVARTRKKK